MNGRSSAAASGRVVVEPFGGDDRAWDDFVEQAPTATVFHLSAWRRTIEGSFGYRPCHLVARRDGRITGVLPLFELGSRRRPRCLLSSPFAVDGGVCAVDPESTEVLLAAAVALQRERGARVLELRSDVPDERFHPVAGRSFRFRRAIYPTDDQNLKAMRPKQRSMVRIGQRSGLDARFDEDEMEVFYDLFAHSMRRLGTPVFPLPYLRMLRQELGARSQLVIVRRGGTPVAGAFSFVFRHTIAPYYVGARREYFRYAINDFMYWEIMRRARAAGLTEFDFGRSRGGSGALAFKRHWGFEGEPIRYSVRTIDGTPPVSDTGGELGLVRRAWMRLPLSLTRLLGPPLIKRIGVYHT